MPNFEQPRGARRPVETFDGVHEHNEEQHKC